MLGEGTNGEQLREEWFSGPNYVLREPISLRDISEQPDAPLGRVIVSFGVSVTGQTVDLKIVESTPAGLKDEAVRRHIRRSRFRPHVRAGELVAADNLALQFNFRYTPDAVAAQASQVDTPSRRQ
jgi:TonB family protein